MERTERDTQKSRVYKSDKALIKLAKPLTTVKDIEKFADRLFTMKRLAHKYPFAIRRGAPVVKDGRGQRRATGGSHAISIPIWARNEAVVLHELAHAISDRQYGVHVAGHGWQFASTYLDLAKWMMGQDAHSTLKAAFKQNKVRFKPPRAKRELTPEQRAVLVVRLQAARLKRAA